MSKNPDVTDGRSFVAFFGTLVCAAFVLEGPAHVFVDAAGIVGSASAAALLVQ